MCRARFGVGAQTQAYRDVDGASDPDLLDQLGERGIGRQGQRVGHAQRAAVSAGVLHAPCFRRTAGGVALAQTGALECRRNVQQCVDPHPHVQGGGAGEDLEDRSGTVAHLGVGLRLHRLPGFQLQPVAPVVAHREHPVGVLARPDDAHDAGHAVEHRTRDGVDGLLDVVLNGRIQGGLDQVAVTRHFFFADPRVGQVVQRVLAEEGAIAGRDATLRKCSRLRKDAQRLRLGGTQFLCVVRQVLDHRVQHQVPAVERTAGIGVGIQRAGRLHQTCQKGGLLPVEQCGVDTEVGLRGVLNPVGAVSERHEVEVAGQDLRLGQRLVQSQCHPDLAQLTGGCGLDRRFALGVGCGVDEQVEVLDVLLLDGRPAARVAGALEEAGQAGEGALQIDTVVVGETLVLDGDDRQLHGVGDAIGRHLEPALHVEPGDGIARGIDHRRDRGDLVADDVRGALGDRLRRVITGQTQTGCDGEEQSCQQDPGQHAVQRHPGKGRPCRWVLLGHADRLGGRYFLGPTAPAVNSHCPAVNKVPAQSGETTTIPSSSL